MEHADIKEEEEVVSHARKLFDYCLSCMVYLVIRIPERILNYTLHSIASFTDSTCDEVYFALRSYVLGWSCYAWEFLMYYDDLLPENERGSMYTDILLQKIFEDEGEEFDPVKLEESDLKVKKQASKDEGEFNPVESEGDLEVKKQASKDEGEFNPVESKESNLQLKKKESEDVSAEESSDSSGEESEDVFGEVKLYDGYIARLNTLHRHCISKMWKAEGRLFVETDLRANNLDFHYSGKIQYMDFKRTFAVAGVYDIIVNLKISFNAQTGEDGRLDMLKFFEVQRQISVKGLGPLRWAESEITDHAGAIFKKISKNVFEIQIAERINEILPDFGFPVDNANGYNLASDQISTETVSLKTSKIGNGTCVTETNLKGSVEA